MNSNIWVPMAAAASLVMTPSLATAQEAQVARGSAVVGSESSELRGSPSLLFIGAIVAVALGIVLLIDDDDAASP